MDDFKQCLLNNRQYFMQELVVADVLPKLHDDRAISTHEHDTLKAMIDSGGNAKAANQLIVLLTKKDIAAYESFISATKNTGQNALAKQLQDMTIMESKSKSQNVSCDLVSACRRIVHDMINNKDCSCYDLLTFLRKNKGTGYKTLFDLSDDEGLPLTHMCVDRERLNLLPVFLYMGWWRLLSRKKISETSSSTYKGMTCLGVAKKKGHKKAIDEVKLCTDWENSLSEIMRAARCGDSTNVSYLLKDGESVYYSDMNNGNALFWAVVSGNLDIFHKLLDEGNLDSTMRTRDGETLLHIACRLGMPMFIPHLLRFDMDPYQPGRNGKCAVDRVAENGDIEAFMMLRDCEIEPNQSFLTIAAYAGKIDLLKFCIEEKIFDVNSTDEYNRTAVMRAVEGNKVDVVKYLLEKKADLSITPTTNQNLLHALAQSGSIDLLNVLLPKLRSNGLLDKFIAQKDRYNGEQLCFCFRGVDNGRDAWHYVEVVRHRAPIFLKRTKLGNVDVAAFGTVVKSGWGENPEQEDVDNIEKRFKQRKLDMTAPRDSTPLHIATFKENRALVRQLLILGARVNERDKFGNTALMLAAAVGDKDIIKELEEHGVNFNDVNIDGSDALDIARENGHDALVKYISARKSSALFQAFKNKLDVFNALDRDIFEKAGEEGKDVTNHIAVLLRELNIDINQLLVGLGKCPIVQESCDEINPELSQQSICDGTEAHQCQEPKDGNTAEGYQPQAGNRKTAKANQLQRRDGTTAKAGQPQTVDGTTAEGDHSQTGGGTTAEAN